MAFKNTTGSAKLVKWNFTSCSRQELEFNKLDSGFVPTLLSVPFHLLLARKLVLLVDLDQTLIHTTIGNVPLGIVDVHHFESRGSWYHTRVRPGTKAFLQNMSELFELHIWTYADRPYSNEIARLLDPDGSLFSRRILSRDEFIDPDSKAANLKHFFPNGDCMVCIIDDRADVWNDAPNLVAVKPYTFFTDTGYMDHPSEEKEKIGYFQKLHENDDDDHLICLEEKLCTVHYEFYDTYDKMKENGCTLPDVRELVPRASANVLKSVNIVFSGIIPTNIAPETHKTWKMAKSLGAVIQNKVVGPSDDPDNKPTTHVISSRLDTEKVYIAGKLKNVHVVTPNWLSSCAELWQKADEKLFPLLEIVDESANNNGKSKISTAIKPLQVDEMDDLSKKTDNNNLITLKRMKQEVKTRRGIKNKRQEADSQEEILILKPCKKHHFDLS